MDTPAITIKQLAALMTEYADRASDPSIRRTGETDEVLLGNLAMLDAICEPLWTSGQSWSSAEDMLLRAAKAHADRAWEKLSDKIAAAA